jgi:hypothetical protein
MQIKRLSTDISVIGGSQEFSNLVQMMKEKCDVPTGIRLLVKDRVQGGGAVILGKTARLTTWNGFAVIAATMTFASHALKESRR